MKRSWFSGLLIVGVIGLLTLFLGLQYMWLTEVSEATRERMHKRVETDANRFAEDFDREMQAAYYNFQTPASVWRDSAWDEFSARYDFWKQKTLYPELIRGIYFFGKDADAKPLKYDPDKREFFPTDADAALAEIRDRYSKDPKSGPVYDDAFAMVVPIYEGDKRMDHVMIRRVAIPRSGGGGSPPMVTMPDRFGSLIVLLDEPTIKQHILPDLVQKYFPEGDFKVDVVNRSDQPVFGKNDITGSDATAKMFDMSPNNLMFFGIREPSPRTAEDHRAGVVIDQRVETHTFDRTEAEGAKTFNLELRTPPENARLRTSMIASTGTENEPWKLRVQHASGSIDAFVSGERNKSFLIGLGVYLLLVGGIVAILLSAMRSRAFARRQIDFVSSVSHEFRTPLAVIYTAGENLADGVAKENDQVSRYGELIKGEGKKLSAMVEQILEFAGANSGKQKYRFSSTDVEGVVHDALHECQPLIDSGGFTVETDLQTGLPPIDADRVALSSAVQNLIANSVKYANGSKWIKITAKNGGGRVKIAVEDKGIGISSDDLRQIFEPFYRAKQVVDAQISGNGLGLNLVKKIVEAHAGKVSVESTPGIGSVFTIDLPN
ncbi:MAG: hypothetical protein DMF63_03175 [Acidobacteria bacterium]|nr:MAG: hypothetical protein DMF63_03175 [Acidobacteriota bacterium]